jgi:hypothetical protein
MDHRNSLSHVGVVSVLLIAAVTGCSAPTAEEAGSLQKSASVQRATPIAAPYGAAEPRILAIDAFQGRRSSVTLEMEQHTVEGVRIASTLVATQGQATVSIDERADGGSIRTASTTSLVLYRLTPGRWENDIEVEKEHLVPVTPAQARAQAGIYVLAAPACVLGVACPVFF